MGVGGPGRGIGRGSLLIAAVALCAGVSAPSALAAPGNNSYANAQVLTGSGISVLGSNVDAFKEAGEPDHAGNLGGASVWYSWTAPAAGAAKVETCDSGFNTLLAVYRESGAVPPFTNLVPVASNDDFPGCGGGNRSRVDFTAEAGVTYKIAVDGWNNPVIIGDPAASGPIHMRVDGQKAAAAPLMVPPIAVQAPTFAVRRKCARKKRKLAAAAKKRRCSKKRRK